MCCVPQLHRDVTWSSFLNVFLLHFSHRLKCDPNNSLAPSYKTLFDNVDRTVDCDGYENTLPLHLKTITIAGLPVEDIPCLEVWDLSGKVGTDVCVVLCAVGGVSWVLCAFTRSNFT